MMAIKREHSSARSDRRRRRSRSSTPERRRHSRSKSKSPEPSDKRRRHSRSRSGERKAHSSNTTIIQFDAYNEGRIGNNDSGGGGFGERNTYKSRQKEVEQQDQYYKWRRGERTKICADGRKNLWGTSPSRAPGDLSSDDDAAVWWKKEENDAKKKKKKKKEKKHRKKGKKSKKKKRKHKKQQSSDSESSSSDGEEWVEVTKETIEEQREQRSKEDAETIGPMPEVDEVEKEEITKYINYGKDLLRGEGAAMAAFVAQGKRIPRRGEIGVSSDDIETYEKMGYVMSGTRHQRMEATRIRKENQIYSAEEKRMLSEFNKEERAKKEEVIQSQFRQLIDNKMKKS